MHKKSVFLFVSSLLQEGGQHLNNVILWIQLLRDCNVVITRCRERAEEADQLK